MAERTVSTSDVEWILDTYLCVELLCHEYSMIHLISSTFKSETSNLPVISDLETT